MNYYFIALALFTLFTISYIAVNDDGNFAGIATYMSIVVNLIIWGVSLVVYLIMR